MPKVSVIIPLFNRAGFIVETLQSVEGQTLVPLEVLVIDDHSSDDSVEVVQEYSKSSRLAVTLLTNLRHKGPSGAINFGVENAKGEFIALLDSDDLWKSCHLQQLADALIKYPQYDIAFSKIDVFGPAKDAPQKNIDFATSVARCLKAAFEKGEGFFWQSNKQLLYSLLQWGVPFRCQASLIRRSFFLKTSLFFDEAITYCQDAQFMTQSAYHTGFLYLDNIGLRLRRHSENDGDISYGDKIWKSYEKRVSGLKEFFKNKELTSLEKQGLRHLLTGLQVSVFIAKTKNFGPLSLFKESIRLFEAVPSFSTALLVLKLFAKFCLGVLYK